MLHENLIDLIDCPRLRRYVIIRRCPVCSTELEFGEDTCDLCGFEAEHDEVVIEFDESLDWDDEITGF